MPDRRHARILAMQSLCQLDVLADDFFPQLDGFLAEETDDRALRDYARHLVRDAWQHRDELDAAIQAVAEHWDLRRMTTVDRNVLRVAVCELLHRPEIPPPVAIDEAVEIGKTFGTADSAAFINGILDAVLKRRAAEKEGSRRGAENAEAEEGSRRGAENTEAEKEGSRRGAENAEAEEGSRRGAENAEAEEGSRRGAEDAESK